MDVSDKKEGIDRTYFVFLNGNHNTTIKQKLDERGWEQVRIFSN